MYELSQNAKFGCICEVNQQPFPQGVGRTKKEAKTEAARHAFSMLLGIEEPGAEGE